MNKHTQGPWTFDPEDIMILDSSGSLCLAQPRNYACSIETRNANGRLIAAAPELLEALQELAELASQCDSWQSFPDAPIKKAYAAINKATGESNV